MLYELRFLETLHSAFSSPLLDRIFVFISFLGNGGMVWILLSIALLSSRKTRRIGLVTALSLIIEVILCSLLKMAFARPRPFVIDRSVQLLIDPPLDYSFPSGHSASSFAALWSVRKGGCRIFIPSLILACLIAFSRLYLFVHYPSDVAAGIILGILCSLAAEASVAFILPRIGRLRDIMD